jgi:hypothetical protein
VGQRSGAPGAVSLCRRRLGDMCGINQQSGDSRLVCWFKLGTVGTQAPADFKDRFRRHRAFRLGPGEQTRPAWDVLPADFEDVFEPCGRDIAAPPLARRSGTVKLLPPVWPVSQLASHWTCTWASVPGTSCRVSCSGVGGCLTRLHLLQDPDCESAPNRDLAPKPERVSILGRRQRRREWPRGRRGGDRQKGFTDAGRRRRPRHWSRANCWASTTRQCGVSTSRQFIIILKPLTLLSSAI